MKKQNKQQFGFTMVEIMVVVVILGILASIVVPRIVSRPDEARIVRAKQDILAIENALALYRLDNNFYPTTDQGLLALVEQPNNVPNWKAGGYLRQVPLDPWGTLYQYLNPGIHSEIDIFSFGTNGQQGSANNDTTIGNWDLN